MTGHATIGIDDNLAPGQASIAHRAASDKASGGINEDSGVAVEHMGRDGGLNNMLDDIIANLLWIHIVRVLRRNDHRINPDGTSIFILNGHLTLAIWAPIRH